MAKSFGLVSNSKEYDLLKEELDSLVISGTLTKSSRRRYSLPDMNGSSEQSGTVGIFQHEMNISAFYPEDGSKKLRVKFADTSTALHGDKVRVDIIGKGKKKSARIKEVLDRAEHKIIGHVESDGLEYYLVADDKHYHVDFLLRGDNLDEILPLQKVTAEFIKWNDVGFNPEVQLTGVFSDEDKIKSLFKGILKEYSLSESFPPKVEQAATKYKVPSGDPSKGRKDCRHLDVITIDPADARDFDDALSLEYLENGNYRLGIHIADVSTYVKEGTALDDEAFNRGNSTYLVDRVVPMLPEHISNVVCSLNPNEERNAFTVFAELTKQTKLVDYEITETLIRSKRRFAYEEAQEVLDNGEGDYHELLSTLNTLAKKLRTKRFKSGGIEFETTETRYRTDEKGYPSVAELKKPTESTQLIEEFMLLANRIVAGFVKDISKKYQIKPTLPYLFRIHEQPEPEMLKQSLEYVSRIGHFKHDSENISSFEINRILKSFDGKPEQSIVNSILIRSMPKAVYSHVNMGHYGLGFKDYAHFTSPIRRYPDLLVHRLIKEYQKSKPEPQRIAQLRQEVKEAGTHSSATERTSMEAERSSKKVAGAILAYDKLGEVFEGTVTGVMHFGIFVQLDGILSEGLIHIRDLSDDYYTYDENNFMLRGKKKENTFRLGDRVKAEIIRVVLDKRQIDLNFVGRISEE